MSAQLTGLASATTYHYRVVATGAVSTSYGEDMTFTTAAAASGEPVGTTGSTGGSSNSSSTSSSSTSGTNIGSSPGIASTAKAIEDVLLGCSDRQLVLNDVYIDGGHVAISGGAAKSLVGKKVKILFNERKQVATATVRANGQSRRPRRCRRRRSAKPSPPATAPRSASCARCTSS